MLACALQAHGLAHGDRVAVLAPNGRELLEAHYGVPWSGAALVVINTRLMPEEIGYILEHSGSRLLVVDPTLEQLVPESGSLEVLRCGAEYEDFVAAASGGEPESRLETEDDTISIDYTSGTTGRPKGVMYTHRGAYLNALAEMHHAGLDSRSVYLWTLPCSIATDGASPGQ
jgi:fatty-acyl-CoA synthase